MSNLGEIATWLNERLPGLLKENRIPGAAVAVLAGGEVIDAAAGVLSLATGVEATTDSVFQIGSITKVWTTTLVMQLVDEGRVDIDEPVRRYLPEFVIADEAAAASITVRQLLCHTSGFEGDIFTDTGPGDDCIEKYVATLREVGQLFPPGERFSYNNAAFCVLGRLVEVMREKRFDDCLREHVFTPLGLTHVANNAGEAILYRAAVGHIQPTPDAAPTPAPIWSLMRSNIPAGAMLAMRPRDLVAFVQMHLAGGVGPGGTTVLSPDSVKAMQVRQVELPELGLMGDAWGLGWEQFDWTSRRDSRSAGSIDSGGPVIGHDGGTIGQSAFLRVVPDRGVAVALLTNGGNVFSVYTELIGRVLRELAGVEMPPLPKPPAQRQPVDAHRYVGTYSSEAADLVVSQDADGRVWLEQTPKGVLRELGGAGERKEIVLLKGETFVQVEPQMGIHMPCVFVGDDGTGRALYLHHGRATRRLPNR